MKRNITLLTLIAIFLSSCQEKILLEPIQISPNVEKIVKFQGEDVVLPDNVPIEFLGQTTENFIKYIEKEYFIKPNARTNIRPRLSLEESVEIIRPLREKYPIIDVEKPLNNKDIKRILTDFKSITTVEDILLKSDVIIAFYDALLKAEALPKLVDASIKRQGAKTTLYTMNPYESSVVWNHPMWAMHYLSAGQTAQSYYAADGSVGNAVQHSVWNCLIIRRLINSGASKNNAVNYAKETTSAHEWNSEGTAKLSSNHTAMDLHNNRAGRTWMDKNTGWGFFGIRKMPSEGDIVGNMVYLANFAGNWGSGAPDNIVNNGGGWDSLYDASTWNFPWEVYFVYIN